MKKKWGMTLLILTIFATILTGCGGKDTAAPENAVKTEQAKKEDKTTQEQTRVIEHAMGKTEIKGTPQKVVVLTNESTEAVLELGVIPVGAVKSGVGETWFPHILEEMKNVPELGEESLPNLEAIANLKPDLIFGNKVRHEEIYTQLSDIAPTVFSEDLAGRWKENFTLYAKALNKETEGKEAMSKYDAHVEKVKTNLSDQLTMEISIVRFLPTTVRIYQKDTFAGTILSDVGFARPASQDVDNFMEVITEEQMGSMDGDVMFYFNADYDAEKGGTKMQEEWMTHPLYQKLNVAKNNKAFKVDEIIWNLSGGIKSANLLLDDITSNMENLK
ncbi:ABC transporter substrate-binding protein [Bacillus sp. 31A1R]|uniref:ABC transporter substrate-binding protein n=1 Tax=Robertmurraya mangrovi TaxID=3098077 RepID=A0ABU5J2L1_9BACI|nr:ABC transporter substrate-binding protein [Bacillus sp. 31A1R]MDZ5473581.1 ABC transporter substrate-binding protein [Bacillus sp. 31A1R]